MAAIECLGDDVLCLLLGRLRTRHMLQSAALVCKRWHQLCMVSPSRQALLCISIGNAIPRQSFRISDPRKWLPHGLCGGQIFAHAILSTSCVDKCGLHAPTPDCEPLFIVCARSCRAW